MFVLVKGVIDTHIYMEYEKPLSLCELVAFLIIWIFQCPLNIHYLQVFSGEDSSDIVHTYAHPGLKSSPNSNG